jgi:hypothetical protein
MLFDYIALNINTRRKISLNPLGTSKKRKEKIIMFISKLNGINLEAHNTITTNVKPITELPYPLNVDKKFESILTQRYTCMEMELHNINISMAQFERKCRIIYLFRLKSPHLQLGLVPTN